MSTLTIKGEQREGQSQNTEDSPKTGAQPRLQCLRHFRMHQTAVQYPAGIILDYTTREKKIRYPTVWNLKSFSTGVQQVTTLSCRI